MKSFAVDWLGRTGPLEIVVEMPVEAAREQLQRGLVTDESESVWQASLKNDRRYSGTFRDNTFDLTTLWRNRRFRPTMTGRFEPMPDETTRIHFQVEMDSTVLLMLVLPWFLYFTGMIALFFSTVDSSWLRIAGLLPVMLLLVSAVNLWAARREAGYMLEFFVARYRKYRIEE